ncbi:NAD(P)H oxidoreductase YRKL [Minicystis rosea]|nr:NAD(P)H oxidoreductase YRKL [Minicystis rosea]
MNVFIVYAHPEPRSLNGSLERFMVEHLERQGHVVQVSNLYAMRWKSHLDTDDFPARSPDARLHADRDSRHAYEGGTQTADVVAEQQKLLWADVVILQFPLWWYAMPAILKGWVDRVFACGFAYGVGEHSDKRWGDRFGEGVMVGKRAMLVVTAGGWSPHYGPRGINGPMEDLLFPIHHGILFYPGFTVLPPFVVYRTDKIDDARFTQTTEALGRRLDTLATTPPIAYRMQNGGDYEIPAMTLRPHLAPDREGFGVHVDER